MRELTADLFVSLDGFAAGADGGQSWTFGYFGPQFAEFVQQVLAEPQVMIMGRVTYEIMARAWPSSPDPLAGPMNSLPKLVFSTTLSKPLAWNNAQLAKHALVAEIRALKARLGDPLRTIGSITVGRQLIAAGLVDRLRLVVFPHVLGQAGHEPGRGPGGRVPGAAGWSCGASGGHLLAETGPGVARSRRRGGRGGLRVAAGADGTGVSCGWPARTTSL